MLLRTLLGKLLLLLLLGQVPPDWKRAMPPVPLSSQVRVGPPIVRHRGRQQDDDGALFLRRRKREAAAAEGGFGGQAIGRTNHGG